MEGKQTSRRGNRSPRWSIKGKIPFSLFFSVYKNRRNVHETVCVEKSTYDVSIHWMKRERERERGKRVWQGSLESPDDDERTDEENVFFGGEGRVNVDLSMAHFPNGDGGWSLVHRPLWYPLPPRGTHSFETRPIAIFYEKMSRKKVCQVCQSHRGAFFF